MADKMELQGTEFAAARDFVRAYNNLPAVVDDDYPEMRHYYEGAVQRLIEAFTNNGRSKPKAVLDNYGELERQIAERSKKFKDNFTNISEKQRFMTLALVGEAGELANVVKKDWREGTTSQDAILDELSDVFVYWVLSCHAHGYAIMDVMQHGNSKAERRLQEVLAKRARP